VKRASILVPILLGFGAMLLILSAVVLANIYQTHQFSQQIRAIILERNKKSDLAALMAELQRDRYRSLKHASALADPFERDDEIRHFRNMAGAFIRARDEFLALPLDDGELATWQGIREAVRRVEGETEAIISYLESDDATTARLLIGTRLTPLQEQMMAGWDQMLYVQNEKNRQALVSSERIDAELRQLSIVLGGVAVLIGFSVAVFAVRTSRRLEEALVNEKVQAQATLEAITDAVIRINPGGEICYLNQQAEALLDERIEPGACKPLDALQLVDRRTREPLLSGVLDDLRRDMKVQLPDEACLITAAGMEYDVQGSASPYRVAGQAGAGAVFVLRDVTETRNALRRHALCAEIDPITGLTDSRLIEERLSDALRGQRAQDQPLGFVRLHLDNLGDIRAHAGMSAADQLLRQASQSLRLHIRDRDLIGLMDGDAVGVLLPACQPDKVRQIAEQSRRTLASLAVEHVGGTLHPSVQMGEVCIPPFNGTLEDCMRAAGAPA